jgi:hypothetical protein
MSALDTDLRAKRHTQDRHVIDFTSLPYKTAWPVPWKRPERSIWISKRLLTWSAGKKRPWRPKVFFTAGTPDSMDAHRQIWALTISPAASPNTGNTKSPHPQPPPQQ